MKPYAFFLDIDGTLLSKNGIPEENIEAIKKAQREGHFVLLNTGRAYAAISEEIRSAAAFDGIVAALGGDIRIRGKQVQVNRMPAVTACALVELFLSMPEQNLFLTGEEVCFVTNPKFLWGDRILLKSAAEYREKYMHFHVSKMSTTVLPDRSVMEPFLQEFTPYYHPTYFEFALKGCSKSAGMAVAAKHLGVPKERCVAIGDSANDIEMLTAAGVAVVMGNYDPGTEKYADFITDTAENAGVAKAILKLIEEK